MGFWKTYLNRKEADILRGMLSARSKPDPKQIASALFMTVPKAAVGAGRFIVSPASRRISAINSAVRRGECPGCGKKMAKDSLDHYHNAKCAMQFAQGAVSDWKSIDQKNNTLYYDCGIHNRNSYADFQHDQICDTKKSGW